MRKVVTCNIGTAQCKDDTIKYEKNKGTTKYEKSTVHVMLVLYNVRKVPSNVRKNK